MKTEYVNEIVAGSKVEILRKENTLASGDGPSQLHPSCPLLATTILLLIPTRACQ